MATRWRSTTCQRPLQDQILDYKLMVYFCSGTDKEKLDWFRIINIAGERLTDQELRNAVYTGPWLYPRQADLLQDELSRLPARQQVRERRPNPPGLSGDRHLVAVRRPDRAVHVGPPARSERQRTVAYFQAVIALGGADVHHIPQGDEGRRLGRACTTSSRTACRTRQRWRQEIKALMVDDDVTRKKGIYSYCPDPRGEVPGIRPSPQAKQREAYERQGGICPICGKHFEIRVGWKPTTSPRGRRAGRRTQPTARCCAARTTDARAAYRRDPANGPPNQRPAQAGFSVEALGT